MKYSIPRCYDSHTHLLGTGILQKGLRLFDLRSPQDLARVEIKSEYFRGEWLVGFGWDQHKFPGKKYPTKEDLDKIFPDFPVAFSRADGHATWMNSKALQKTGYYNLSETQKKTPTGGVIIRDGQGHPTGIFVELAKIYAETFIPEYSEAQVRYFLVEAIRYFNQQGFTHLRDMSGFYLQWKILRELDLQNQLTLYIDQNFTCENIEDFARALNEAEIARNEQTKHLYARGIKFYFDGALGSEGAYLSKNYLGKDSRGMTLWPLEHVEEVIKKTWQKNLEVSVHTIGDEAAHQVISVAHKIFSEHKISGVLNIEHAEIMRPETIRLLKDLKSICHIQPCHWLSDRHWLKEKLGDLYQYAFPWKELADQGVTIQWGSDSPIEEASVANNLRALAESSHDGIEKYPGDFLKPHSHRDPQWGADCFSEFADDRVIKVVFDGAVLGL